MRTLRRTVCLVIVCMAVAPAAAQAGKMQDSLIAAVNYARAANGLGTVSASSHLNRSASKLSKRLMRSGWFGHPGSIQAGGGFRSLGEALHLHTGTSPRPRATVRGWLRSPAHRGLVLGPFSHAGAGIARGTFQGRASTIWVLHVGAY